MMEKMEAAKQQLRQDIESYTRGEEPSPIEMVRAARLDDWEAAVRRRGKEFILVISGAVRGHPVNEDGAWITTSAVVWFDRKRQFIRTHSRLYALGQPAGTEIPIEGIDA